MNTLSSYFSWGAAIILLLIVVLLGVTYFSGDNVTRAEVYEPHAEYRTETPAVAARYVVTVANDVVFMDDTMAEEEARSHCQSIAYDANNMWKQVICTFDGAAFYNDVFVAG